MFASKEMFMEEKKIEHVSQEEIKRVITGDDDFSYDAEKSGNVLKRAAEKSDSRFFDVVLNSDLNPAKLKKESEALAAHLKSDDPAVRESALLAASYIQNGSYINKLKNSEIEKWFEPFGLVSLERHDGFAYVICGSFSAMFNNFNLLLDDNSAYNGVPGFYGMPSEEAPQDDLYESSELENDTLAENIQVETASAPVQESTFDFEKFCETCDLMDMTPAQALEEYVAIKLSERFPSSYPAARKQFKDQTNNNALKAFAKSGASEKLVDLMREIKNRQDAANEATHNRGHYGFYNPNDKR